MKNWRQTFITGEAPVADFEPADRISKHLWSIILAGGNGDRISSLTLQWMGRSVPKQYCAFVGKKSMLQHTLMRADALGEHGHQRTLIARNHQNEALPQLADRWDQSVILQPSNRNTLPGIFLPLTHIYARDSNATVVIYPSDHFIYPRNNFIRLMEQAVKAAEELPGMLILIGAKPDSLELDYGWIYPAEEIWQSGDYSVRIVKQFLEKPSRALAAEAMLQGAFWNTLIVAVKAHTLWELGWTHAPEILRHFERLCNVVGTSKEKSVLESIYEIMPSGNFSSDLLMQAAGSIGVLPMENILWNDWGRKERIVETLSRIGLRPNFPMETATGHKPDEQTAENLSAAFRENLIRRAGSTNCIFR